MPYLLIDHGGVLEGQVVKENEIVDGKDLDLSKIEDENEENRYSQVIKNGVQFIKDLNALAQLGFKIVFHSANSFDDQFRLLNQIDDACEKKGLSFPTVHGMVAYDHVNHPEISYEKPEKIERNSQKREKIPTFCWGKEEPSDGKASLRHILETQLNISKEDKERSYVLDDGLSVIDEATKEGYQAILIQGETNVAAAVSKILEIEQLKDENKTSSPYSVSYFNTLQLNTLLEYHNEVLCPENGKKLSESYQTLTGTIHRQKIFNKKEAENPKRHSSDGCAYGDNMGVFQDNLSNFNAQELVPDSIFSKTKKSRVLSEGPNVCTVDNFAAIPSKSAIYRFKDTLIPYLVERSQGKSPVTIAIGKSIEKETLKFANYMDRQIKVQAIEFLTATTLLTPEQINAFDKSKLFKNTNFHFYKVRDENRDSNGKESYFYTLHVTTWPDHQMPEFSNSDLYILALLADYCPALVAHCSAGLNRSPCLLTLLMAYQEKIHPTSSSIDDYLIKFSKIAERSLEVKQTSNFGEGRPFAHENQYSAMGILCEKMEQQRPILDKALRGELLSQDELNFNVPTAPPLVSKKDEFKSTSPVNKDNQGNIFKIDINKLTSDDEERLRSLVDTYPDIQIFHRTRETKAKSYKITRKTQDGNEVHEELCLTQTLHRNPEFYNASQNNSDNLNTQPFDIKLLFTPAKMINRDNDPFVRYFCFLE